MPKVRSGGDVWWGKATEGVVATDCWRGGKWVTKEEEISVVGTGGDVGLLLNSMPDSRWRLRAGVGKGSVGAKITNVDSFSVVVGSGHDMGVGLMYSYGKRRGPVE